MKNARIVSLAAAISILMLPSIASAKISKDLREELKGYVESLSAEKDPQIKQATATTTGWLLRRGAARKALEPAKTSDVARVRIGAGMGLILAGVRKSDEFLIGELQKSPSSLYGNLREVVSVLPDDEEAEFLEEFAAKSKPKMQRDVMRYLAAQDDELFGVLADAAEQGEETLREAAIRALVAWPTQRALDLAGRLLSDEDEAARVGAVSIAVAASHDDSLLSEAMKLLEKGAEDDARAVREKAARRLVELNNDAGVKALLLIAKDLEESSERQPLLRFVLESNAKPKYADVKPLLDSAEKGAEKTLALQLAAASGSDEIYDKLVEMYGSTEFDERLEAVRAIGYTDNPKAAAILTRSLFEGRSEIRLAAAKSLDRLAEESALASLRKAVKMERDPKVKLAVIDAVGSIESPRALQTLRFLVTDRSPDVKKATLNAIREIGLKEGAKALDVLLRDRNVDIQWAAFITAMDLDPDAGKRHMKQALRNPPDSALSDIETLGPAVQRQIFEYLFEKGGSQKGPAVRRAMRLGTYDDALRELLSDTGTSTGLRREILLYFADAGGAKNKALFERLVRKGGDERISRLAAWMLTRWSTPDLEPSFRGYLGMKDKVIRAVAVYGLATIYGK